MHRKNIIFQHTTFSYRPQFLPLLLYLLLFPSIILTAILSIYPHTTQLEKHMYIYVHSYKCMYVGTVQTLNWPAQTIFPTFFLLFSFAHFLLLLLCFIFCDFVFISANSHFCYPIAASDRLHTFS